MCAHATKQGQSSSSPKRPKELGIRSFDEEVDAFEDDFSKGWGEPYQRLGLHAGVEKDQLLGALDEEIGTSQNEGVRSSQPSARRGRGTGGRAPVASGGPRSVRISAADGSWGEEADFVKESEAYSARTLAQRNRRTEGAAGGRSEASTSDVDMLDVEDEFGGSTWHHRRGNRASSSRGGHFADDPPSYSWEDDGLAGRNRPPQGSSYSSGVGDSGSGGLGSWSDPRTPSSSGQGHSQSDKKRDMPYETYQEYVQSRRRDYALRYSKAAKWKPLDTDSPKATLEQVPERLRHLIRPEDDVLYKDHWEERLVTRLVKSQTTWQALEEVFDQEGEEMNSYTLAIIFTQLKTVVAPSRVWLRAPHLSPDGKDSGVKWPHAEHMWGVLGGHQPVPTPARTYYLPLNPGLPSPFSTSPQSWETLDEEGMVGLRSFIMKLMAAATERLGQMSTLWQPLSILEGLAWVKYRDEEFHEKLFDRILVYSNEFNSRMYRILLWSLGVLGFKPEPLVIEDILEATGRMWTTTNPQNVALTTWGLACLGICPTEEWLDNMLVGVCRGCCNDFPPVSPYVVHCAVLSYHALGYSFQVKALDDICYYLMHNFDQLDLESVDHLVGALHDMRYSPTLALVQAYLLDRSSRMRHADNHQLIAMVDKLTMLGLCPDQEWLSRYVTALTHRVIKLSADELLIVAKTLSQFGEEVTEKTVYNLQLLLSVELLDLSPSELADKICQLCEVHPSFHNTFLDDQLLILLDSPGALGADDLLKLSRALLPPNVQSTMKAEVLQLTVDSLQKNTSSVHVDTICQALTFLLRHNLPVSQELMQSCVAEIEKRASQCQAKDAVGLLYILSTSSFNMTAAGKSALVNATSSYLGQMPPHLLVQFLLVIDKLGVRLDEPWKNAFFSAAAEKLKSGAMNEEQVARISLVLCKVDPELRARWLTLQ